MLALVALLVLVTLILTISRVAAVALEVTGMARDSAQFQARSAMLGVGFTTSEAEDITTHPVRRKIVLFLMTFGNASIVTGVGSFLLTFINSATSETLERSAILISGLVAILLAMHTKVANRVIERATRAAIGRYTTLDTSDYHSLLRIEKDYAITEIHAREGEWLVDSRLADLHLTKEGVVVLGLHRSDGTFVGAPHGDTVIHNDDLVLAYGRLDVLQDLATRPRDIGDRVHDRIMAEHEAMRRAAEEEHGPEPH